MTTANTTDLPHREPEEPGPGTAGQPPVVENRKPVIGLVGGIGAGKSTAAAAFASRGGVVINADALGHEALEQPAVRSRVLARWSGHGPLVKPDGRLDRRAIAGIVFADDAERRALQEMVFPVIAERVREEIAKAGADSSVRFVVLDAAVMLEAGWNGVCDHVVYVDAPRPIRLARLAQRSGWNDADVAAREAAQMSADAKRRHATAVLVNDGSPKSLQEKVDHLLGSWGLLANDAPAARLEKSPGWCNHPGADQVD